MVAISSLTFWQLPDQVIVTKLYFEHCPSSYLNSYRCDTPYLVNRHVLLLNWKVPKIFKIWEKTYRKCCLYGFVLITCFLHMCIHAIQLDLDQKQYVPLHLWLGDVRILIFFFVKRNYTLYLALCTSKQSVFFCCFFFHGTAFGLGKTKVVSLCKQ